MSLDTINRSQDDSVEFVLVSTMNGYQLGYT